MSPRIFDVDVIYIADDMSVGYTKERESITRIIAFSEEELAYLLDELGARCKTYVVTRKKQTGIRALDTAYLAKLEWLLIDRLYNCIEDLEIFSEGDPKKLRERIKCYREVGRSIFNLTDERMRK